MYFPYITRNFNVQIWFTSAIRIRGWLRRTNCDAPLGHNWCIVCDNIQGPHRLHSIVELGGRTAAAVQRIMWSIGDCLGCWRTTRHSLWAARAQVNLLVYWFIFNTNQIVDWIKLNRMKMFCFVLPLIHLATKCRPWNLPTQRNNWLRRARIRCWYFGKWMQCARRCANGSNPIHAKCVHGHFSGIYVPWWINGKSAFDNIIAVIVAKPSATSAQAIASIFQSWALNSMYEFAIHATIN